MDCEEMCFWGYSDCGPALRLMGGRRLCQRCWELEPPTTQAEADDRSAELWSQAKDRVTWINIHDFVDNETGAVYRGPGPPWRRESAAQE